MSKKSDAIFEATADAIRKDIWRGHEYDSLTHVIYRNGDAPVQRTVNDMMKRWERLAASIERDIRFYQRNTDFVEEFPSTCKSHAINVEVARRLYLTIQHEQARLDAEKAFQCGEIDFNEYLSRCM